MAFNKHKNMLKGISNVVEATSKEEQIHGDFGIDLIKILVSLELEIPLIFKFFFSSALVIIILFEILFDESIEISPNNFLDLDVIL